MFGSKNGKANGKSWEIFVEMNINIRQQFRFVDIFSARPQKHIARKFSNSFGEIRNQKCLTITTEESSEAFGNPGIFGAKEFT